MWFSENIGSIIVCALLIGIAALLIVLKIRSKKKGKGGCGCGCSDCSMRDICHKENKSDSE